MIVRDEAHVIERCLASVLPLVDCWLIVDTGSSDSTVHLVKKILANLPGRLVHTNWISFAHNRNHALALAKELASHVLFVDADDVYVPQHSNDKINRLNFVGSDVNYVWAYDHNGIRHQRIASIRSDLDAYWSGDIHEYLVLPEGSTSSNEPNFFIRYLGGGARANSSSTFETDTSILLNEIKKYHDGRAIFYLALTYFRHGDFSKALRWFNVRASLEHGEEEERWYAAYQSAITARMCGATLQDTANALARCITSRPTRAEPCIELSSILRLQHCYKEAISVAEYSLTLAPPEDLLFVDIGAYSWQPLEEMSINTAYIGDANKALHFARGALEKARSCISCSPEDIRRLSENAQVLLDSTQTVEN
jgi:tetratricopeptide (TPR) repeat protein